MVQYRLVCSMEIEREADGRWIAEVPDRPGVQARRVLATC
jgi:predicted RNase H-like HicB family nuclease